VDHTPPPNPLDHAPHQPDTIEEPQGHVPVMLSEVIEHLALAPGSVAIDCTAGLGGHAEAIARVIGPTGTLVVCDLDPSNLTRAEARLRALPEAPTIIALRGNFADAPRRLVELGLSAHAVLADLGFASTQVADASRGFSFKRDGPLDMRLDPQGPVTAAHLIATLPEPELAEIIRDLGEEPRWRAVAQKLVEARRAAPILTTGQFASIVRTAAGSKGAHERIDPATRTFQAIRIAVNDELGCLRALLETVSRAATARLRASLDPSAPALVPSPWLQHRARVAIISFHSLEDRLVKQAFADMQERGTARQLSRRPFEASEEEVRINPRSRSAKLRVVELP
jgi:16S rRNA (cytosine1402-N4)-methyltransferase